MNKLFLYFTKITGWLPSWIIFKWKTYFVDKKSQGTYLPPGTILMSNHKSLWDFPLYLIVFFRAAVHFQVAEVMYNKGAFMTWLFTKLGCIKVDRLAFDFSFIEESIQLLKKGERVGIFPEGQLPRNGKMSRFTPSCVMIALGADAEIVPVFTDGQYGITKRTSIIVGERIRLRDYCASEHPTKEEIQMCNDILLSKILELEKQLEEKRSAK